MKEAKLNIRDIVPYANNPRNNTKAIEAVAESIKRYGYCTPIVVDEKNVIIAGHSRYYALLSLNYTEVTVLVSDMPADHAKQFRLLDNKTGEISTWDKESLLAELRAAEGDMTPFFNENELAYLMGDVGRIEQHLPTQAGIDRKAIEMKGHYEKLAGAIGERIMTARCRHCNKTFQFDHFQS